MLPLMVLLGCSLVKVAGDASPLGPSNLSTIANVLERAVPSYTAVLVNYIGFG